MQDANGNVTTSVYDADNRLQATVDALGNRTTHSFDAVGNAIATQDALGYLTTQVFDPVNRVQATIDALGDRTTYSYDPVGRHIAVQDARGNRMTSVYDLAGELIARIDALSNRTTYVYDADGRQTAMVDALQNRSTRVYDVASQMIATIDPLGNRTTYSYDAVGQQIVILDANGKCTTNTYDPARRLTATKNALGNLTTYLYDAVSNKTGFVDSRGNRVTYQYDPANRNTVLIDQLGNRTTYSYDPVGSQTLRIDANGNRTTYSCDALKRQTGLVYQDGSRVTFTYDAVSQRLTMQDSTGTTTFTYNAVRRINTVTYPPNKTITYSYDAVGSRALMIDPDSGRTTYSYDAANNLLTLLNPFGETTTFTYDVLNRAVTIPDRIGISITRSNTTTEQSFFNAAGWMTTIRHQKSDLTVLSAFTYTYDNVGNRLTMAETNGDRVTWTYDAIYELTNERRSGTNAYNTTYTYDATGNRLTKVDSGTTITTYIYDSGNRLLTEQIGAQITTYSFDNNGNTTLKNAAGQLTTYTWDGENRMTKLQQPTSPAVMTFTYNGLSFRRTLHDGTNLSKFIYAWATGTPGIDPVLIESDVNDITVVEYTPALMLRLLSQRRSNVSKWYHPEAIGSIRQLTDATQTPTDTYLYKAFGEEVAVRGTTVNPLRYVGNENYYTDGNSGLMLLGVRWSNVCTGRFLSMDAMATDASRFVYVSNNPMKSIDPGGHDAKTNDLSCLSDYELANIHTSRHCEDQLRDMQPYGNKIKWMGSNCGCDLDAPTDESIPSRICNAARNNHINVVILLATIQSESSLFGPDGSQISCTPDDLDKECSLRRKKKHPQTWRDRFNWAAGIGTGATDLCDQVSQAAKLWQDLYNKCKSNPPTFPYQMTLPNGKTTKIAYAQNCAQVAFFRYKGNADPDVQKLFCDAYRKIDEAYFD